MLFIFLNPYGVALFYLIICLLNKTLKYELLKTCPKWLVLDGKMLACSQWALAQRCELTAKCIHHNNWYASYSALWSFFQRQLFYVTVSFGVSTTFLIKLWIIIIRHHWVIGSRTVELQHFMAWFVTFISSRGTRNEQPCLYIHTNTARLIACSVHIIYSLAMSYFFSQSKRRYDPSGCGS